MQQFSKETQAATVKMLLINKKGVKEDARMLQKKRFYENSFLGEV